MKEVEDRLTPGEVKSEYLRFVESLGIFNSYCSQLERKYGEVSILRPSSQPALPPSRSFQHPEPNGFDADRLPGYGGNGGR